MASLLWGGLNTALQNALAKVPGIEDQTRQQLTAVIDGAIEDFAKQVEDPILQRVDGIESEIQQIRILVQQVLTGSRLIISIDPKPGPEQVNVTG